MRPRPKPWLERRSSGPGTSGPGALGAGWSLLAALCVPCAFALWGCATAHFYDERGKELPGLPFVWKDAEGQPHNAYVKASTGFGAATFSVDRSESGGYTKFSNNLDSTGVADLSATLLEEAFEAGKRAAWEELRSRIERLEDPSRRDLLLGELDGLKP
jgi:hypothetical protein